MKITTLKMGNYMTTVGQLLDEMNREVKVLGKKKQSKIYIEHKGEIWKIQKLQ